MTTGTTDTVKLPSRLSDRQRFVLVSLRRHDGRMYHRRLARNTAEEFDGFTDRQGRRPGRRMTDNHSSTFARSLDRLEDRELIKTLRKPPRFSRREYVRLTDEGAEGAAELDRRVRDGRYALAFDTLDQ